MLLRQVIWPLSFGLIVILLFGLVELVLLRWLNRPWWNHRLIRYSAMVLPLFGCLMMVVWVVGELNAVDWLIFPGMILAVLSLILELSLMISLPLSGVIHLAHWAINRAPAVRKNRKPQTVDTNRRAVLRIAAAALPMAALSSGVAGMSLAFSKVQVYRRPLYIENLPPALEGLRILHLSDLHLRHYFRLDDLAELLTDVERFRPDITLITGDVADDLNMLPDTLTMIDQLHTPLGSFATLGNHEYFRGVARVKKIYGRSPVRLLVNDGARVEHKGSTLFIGGIDDPLAMGAKQTEFFRRTIDKTLLREGGESLRILMSHRPDALDYAAVSGIELTLAGHTHGGQIGFAGRSLMEPLWPDRYLWGHYQIDKGHLYTSSGVGHWLPFRLGCPAEAPIIELKSKA